jgi:hypothetical protein
MEKFGTVECDDVVTLDTDADNFIKKRCNVSDKRIPPF